ncbi:MAG: hypothetical protein JNM84_24405 [Planctomycetes bacterium]|nr:hypothetical protein [Planctomycetota bacterium]
MVRSLLAIALAIIASLSLARAQDEAYMFIDDLRLVSVDMMTGSTVSSINARSGGLGYCAALTWNDEARQLWVVEYDATNARIGILDPATAAFTPRRLTAVTGWWMTISWDRTTQRFYLLRQISGGQAYLHVFNPANNTLVQVGELRNEPYPTASDVDASGTLWGCTSPGNIFTINKATGDTTRLQTFQMTMNGIGIHRATGKFYGVGAIGLTQYYFELEPTIPRWRILGSAAPGAGSFDLVDGTCPGGFQLYGSGCPGFGSFVPELTGEGCLGAGALIRLRIARARTGTPGALLFGAGPGALPLGNGCSLLVAPLFSAPVLPLQIIGPGGLGNGYAIVPIRLPAEVVISPLAIQAFLLDAGAPGGFSTTNGLAILAP